MENKQHYLKDFTVPVRFEKAPEDEIPLTAFLFSRNGELLQQAPVENEQAQFKGSRLRSFAEARLFIAPTPPERPVPVRSIADLEKLHAYEPVLDLDEKGNLRVLPIPAYLSRWWCFRFCRVRGQVTKTFTMDGTTQERALCHARVHICEVDKIWWLAPRLPIDILRHIPDIILHPKIPIPVPNPIPDPPPLGPVERFNPVIADFSARMARTSEETAASLQGASLQAGEENFRKTLSAINPALKAQLLSGNAPIMREAIEKNIQLLHPFFCYIPWIWPYLYRCDEIATVYTDMNGRFDTNIFYWDCGDRPDLYFWVEYFIDGVWTTVYRPPVPCYTHWDFACGSEVHIRVTDPRVRWGCNVVLDGDIIWVKTIGHGASVTHILQTDTVDIIQAQSFHRIGLSDVSVPHRGNAVGDFRRPFGGNLYFLLQFGSGLPSAGMSYYRWSYRKLKNADLSPAFDTLHPLNNGEELHKAYSYEFFDALMHKHIAFRSFKLGPVTAGSTPGLFIIPPVSPLQAPVNATELNPQWDQNTVSVVFDSTKFEDGLYGFVLEIFDASGNKVNNIPRQLFQVPDYGSFAPSVDAPDQYLLLNSTTEASAFRMKARIDNQRCEAEIYKIKVDGVESATNCCGFVKYQPASSLEISYRAYHPHNFADFSFAVRKGTCNDPIQTGATNTSGMVIGSTYNGAVENYHRDNASIYTKSFTPAQLLGICNSGGKAAFAESLGVAVLTTNGNDYLELDASDLAAFALEPA